MISAVWEDCFFMDVIIRLVSYEEDDTFRETARWIDKVVLSEVRKVAEAVRVYRRYHKLKRGPCSVKSVRSLIKKSEETRCIWSRSGRPCVPVEVAAEAHNTMTTGPLHTARSLSRNLDAPKTRVLQILCSVLQMFFLLVPKRPDVGTCRQPTACQFCKFFLIRYDEDSRWPLMILWTDEAHFILTGNVNSKNWVH